MVSQGVSMLWSSFIGKKKVIPLLHYMIPSKTKLSQSEERLPLKMSTLVEFVSKKPLPKHTRHLLVEVMVSDEEGEDVEVNIYLYIINYASPNMNIIGTIHSCPNLNVDS